MCLFLTQVLSRQCFAMESVQICHYKTFWVEFFRGEPCCRLDVPVRMLKCVFC